MGNVQIPGYYRMMYSEFDIASATARMGSEIDRWAEEVLASDGIDILALPVLRGGIYFYTDLTRQVMHSIEMMPVRTKSYLHAENGVQSSTVQIFAEDLAPAGRKILLVDDICDSGRTLKALKEYLLSLGASEVRSAVCIHRVNTNSEFQPEYVGFKYSGPEWFVGYGLEDSNRWMNLPRIYALPVVLP